VNISWGAEGDYVTKGLDVLGIRGFDQEHEASLVNGITTISVRTRYVSILTWAIRAYFELETAQAPEGAAVEFDRDAFAVFLNRVRFLTALASFADNGGAGGAVMGTEVFDESIARSTAGQSVELPNKKGLQVLGTYFGPASAMGLVKNEPASRHIPFSLTPRGRKIFEARAAAIAGTGLLELLTEGGQVTPQQIVQAIPIFSVSMIDGIPGELELLREAIQTPWGAGETGGTIPPKVAARYEKMVGTYDWLLLRLSMTPTSASSVIQDNYAHCVSGGQDPIAINWAEAEWQRRTHFTLELLLEAITTTLMGPERLTMSEMIVRWRDQPLTDKLSSIWAPPADPWSIAAIEVAASVPSSLFVGAALPVTRIQEMNSAEQVLLGFALLCALIEQARKAGIEMPATPRTHAHRAMRYVIDNGQWTVAELMHDVAKHCVAQPHIANTFRKMGNQQANSLRLYSDGDRFVTTLVPFRAGYSGNRLGNTMRMLADLKLLAAGPDGTFTAPAEVAR
jgi:hypothetical protein